MIAFNNNQEPNEDKIHKGLKKLLDEVLGLSSSSSPLSINFEPEEYNNINISDITQNIYDKLYQQNKQSMSLLITKNKNNSLNCIIDIIE